MVKVTTKKTIDMSALDFEDFGDAKKLKYDSKTIKLDYSSGRQDRFEGSFSYNLGSKSVSGTAKKWAQYNWHSKKQRWSMTDITLSAAAVLKAAKTHKITDDDKIVAKAFDKADVIKGAGGADYLKGWGGDDEFTGKGGVDHINGGGGKHDIAIFSEKTAPVMAPLLGSQWSIVTVNGVAEDKLKLVEDISGGKKADILTGDGKANLL